MNHSLGIARVVACALVVAATGCGGTEVATAPEVSGPAPALDGTWDYSMERAAANCTGTMTIDGSTGRGTFSGCASQAGTVAGSVDASLELVLLFSPTGLEPYWVRGKLYGDAELSGSIYGPSWNGQQRFSAVRR